MLLDHLLDLAFLTVLCLVLLQVYGDLCSAAKRLTFVLPYCERTTSCRLPDVLLVIVVLEREWGRGVMLS